LVCGQLFGKAQLDLQVEHLTLKLFDLLFELS